MTVHGSARNRHLRSRGYFQPEFLYKYGIPLALALLALVIRAPGLGKWCLTSDEFYFSEPIAFILEKGIPELPTGEFYGRGIALQYLTLFPALLFDKWEFAIRLLPLLFGVLTIIIFYLFCKLFLPIGPALLCSVVLLFSSWHIEFSRFARFYSSFQFMFFLFLYALYLGYWKDNRPYQVVTWFVSFVSIFIFEGAIFLPLVLLVAILIKVPGNHITRRNLEIFLVSTFLLITNYFVNHGGLLKYIVKKFKLFPMIFDNTVVSTLPLSISEGKVNLPITLPNMELMKYVIGHWASALPYIALVLIAGKLYLRQHKQNGTFVFKATLALALFLPLIHQFTVVIFALGIVFLCRDEIKKTFFAKKNAWILYYFVTFCFWVTIIYSAGQSNKILFFLVGYPPIKHSIVIPLFLEMPRWSILIFVTIFILTLCSVFAKTTRPFNYILLIILCVILIMPAFKTPSNTARYMFSFFPLFISLVFGGFYDLVNLIRDRYNITGDNLAINSIVIIPFLLFCFTEDFNPDHMLNVSSKEANFRMGKYEKLSPLWYPRVDLENPVQYVNRNYTEGDIVVLDHVTMSKYIEKPYVNYVYKDAPRFRYHARNGGTIEKWTGGRLLSTPGELASLVPKDNKSLWLVATEVNGYIGTSFAERHFHTPLEIAEKYTLIVAHRYLGLDGRVGVWEFKRSSDRHP